mmetsp:Transcript_16610/g.28294  ORF Transcript_16610/g.28294 Transcript_16610/m.28294 type:complete len:136 (-) Transcript_16610:109-516(-)
MYDYFVERDLSNSVYQLYVSLRYYQVVTMHCYYGLKGEVSVDSLTKLYTELDVLANILFNFGFIWTDIVMLAIGKPGETEKDYGYYVMFYVFDFIFRFVFRQTSSGYCWLPWNGCEVFISDDLSALEIETVEETT